MSKEYLVFLQHILESINIIEKYTKDLSEEAFLESREKQDAVIRRLEIIGEAVKNLPVNSSLLWHRFRNSLEYDYKKPS